MKLRPFIFFTLCMIFPCLIEAQHPTFKKSTTAKNSNKILKPTGLNNGKKKKTIEKEIDIQLVTIPADEIKLVDAAKSNIIITYQVDITEEKEPIKIIACYRYHDSLIQLTTNFYSWKRLTNPIINALRIIKYDTFHEIAQQADLRNFYLEPFLDNGELSYYFGAHISGRSIPIGSANPSPPGVPLMFK